MHLESSHGGDKDDCIRGQTRCPALDVEELFHADVGSEAGLQHYLCIHILEICISMLLYLCDNKPLISHQLECQLVGQD